MTSSTTRAYSQRRKLVLMVTPLPPAHAAADPASIASQAQWQKEYLQGYGPGGMKAPKHQTKVTLREFEVPKPPET